MKTYTLKFETNGIKYQFSLGAQENMISAQAAAKETADMFGKKTAFINADKMSIQAK